MGDPEEDDVYLTPEGLEVMEELVDQGLTPDEALDVIVENEPELDVEDSQNPGDR